MFPQTVLGTKVELYYDGRWNRVPSSDVRGLGAEDGEIKIGQRGQPDESSGLVVTTAELSINNQDGKYSIRNTSGELYGKIGLNTPIRISTDLNDTTDVEEATITHTHNAVDSLQQYTDSRVLTDVDAVVDGVALATAPTGANVEITVRSRISNAGNDWVQGRLVFTTGGTVQVGIEYSVSGTVTSSDLETVAGVSTTDTISIRFSTVGRILYVRAWENGTTEPSTWDVTQETSVLTPGTLALTSILETGNTNVTPYAVTFTDVFVSLGIVLFVGEVSEWPKRWDLSGADVWTTISASGITRRLLQGKVSAGSPLFRALSKLDLVGYWSYEGMSGDGSTVPVLQSGLDDGNAMVIYNFTYNDANVDWSGATDLVGSDSLPTLEQSANATAFLEFRQGRLSPVDTTHNQFSWCFWARLSLSGDDTNMSGYVSIIFTTLNGTFSTWNTLVRMEDVAGTKAIDIDVYADGGGTHAESLTTTYTNDWHFFRFTVDQPAANQLRTRTYMDEVLLGTETEAAGVPNIGQLYDVTSIAFYAGSGSVVTMAGHFAFATGTGTDDIQANAANIYAAGYEGHAGETAVERMTRLSEEEGVTFTVTESDYETGTLMGPQGIKSYVELMEETALTDDGVLFELRDTFGYGYRTRESLYEGTSQLELDYSNSDLSAVPEVTDDDQRTINRFTAKRSGASGPGVTVEQTMGALSTSDPYDDPPGVGIYPDSEEVNVYTDDQLADYAGWRVHLGTWDESRWPGVSVLLERNAMTSDLSKLASAAFLDVAELMTITNTPAWLGTDSVVLQMRAVTVFLSNFSWGIDWTTLPAGPWTEVARVSSASYGRLDTSGSELVSDVDTDDTELVVYTPETTDLPWSDALWTTDIGELNFAGSTGIDLRLNPASRVGGKGGEQVRVVSTPAVSDDFGRSGALIGSTTDTGGKTWANTAGTATAPTTDGTKAVFVHPAANASRFVSVDAGTPDVCVMADMAFNVASTGGGDLSARLVLRQTDSSNYYGAVLTLPSSGSASARLSVVKVVAGSQTTLSSTVFTVDIANTADRFIRVKAMVFNRDIYAKAWYADEGDSAEPDWQISLKEAATDLLTGNSVGLRTLRSTGNTTADATVYFDNFRVVEPKIRAAYYDRFAVAVSNGLGTTTSGQAWSTLSVNGVAAASDFNVASNAATTVHTATDTTRGGYLSSVSLEDASASVVFSGPLPTGATLDLARLMFRGTSTTSYVSATVNVSTAGVMTVGFYSSAGVLLSSRTFNQFTYVANTQYRFKAAVSGLTIMAKLWLATGNEPEFWVTGTLAESIVSGWVGWSTKRYVGNTNVNATVSTRDFRVENPQRIVVTRSVNGISHTWSAGNDIRLWTPAILGR